MQLRRSTARLTGTLLLAVPLVAGCGGIGGLDAATNREYTPATGANQRDADVDILGAVVVSAQDGSGTFVATFVNNDPDKNATVTALEGAPGAPEITVGEFPEITVPARGLANLAAEGSSGIPVSGEVTAGRYLALQVTFGDGEIVDLKVPVVPDREEYSNEFQGLDTSGES